MENNEIEDVIKAAKQSFQSKNYKRAIEGFNKAHHHFQMSGDDLRTAEMANNLSVVLLQAGKKKEALSIVIGTDKIFENHNDKMKQAMALGNIGAALESLKKHDEALENYQKSADLLEQLGESEFRSHVLKSIAMLQIREGKQIESIFSMQRSIQEKTNLSWKDRFLRFLLKIPSKILRF